MALRFGADGFVPGNEAPGSTSHVFVFDRRSGSFPEKVVDISDIHEFTTFNVKLRSVSNTFDVFNL